MADFRTESTAFADRHYFLLRRLHSLLGLVPLGVFLCMHLTVNASILLPGEVPGAEFQRSVERIHALGPLLKPVEIFGIFIPLAFHAVLGLALIYTGRSNVRAYPHGGNIRYMLQRVTAVIALGFILFHVWQMHWLGSLLGGGQFRVYGEFGAGVAAVSTAKPIQAAWWVVAVYGIGIVTVAYHLANGTWTALITWGITIRPRAQRTCGCLCTVFGVAVALLGLAALSGFKTFEPAGPASDDSVRTASAGQSGVSGGAENVRQSSR